MDGVETTDGRFEEMVECTSEKKIGGKTGEEGWDVSASMDTVWTQYGLSMIE